MKHKLPPKAEEIWKKCVEILPFLKKGTWTITVQAEILFSTDISGSMRHLKTDRGSTVEDDFRSMQFGWDPGDPDVEAEEGFWMATYDSDYVIDPFDDEIFMGSNDPFRICYMISPEKTINYLKKEKPPGWHKYVGKELGLF
jgi:hypothetical protein